MVENKSRFTPAQDSYAQKMLQTIVKQHDAVPEFISKTISGTLPSFCHPTACPNPLSAKKLFSIYDHWARPTNGSDCGSLCSHNQTLFVIRYSLCTIWTRIFVFQTRLNTMDKTMIHM